MAVRVKICGITDKSFLAKAQQYPIDAIGLMFYQPSKRYISIEDAAELLEGCSPFINIVGVFVNPEPAYVDQALKKLPLNILQFHGEENAAFCQQFGYPYIKAVPMTAQSCLSSIESAYDSASALLLDKATASQRGGTGLSFDWQWLNQPHTKPIVVAGGINPNNVGHLLKQHQVEAIDVSSGIEAQSGVKSIEQLERLLKSMGKI